MSRIEDLFTLSFTTEADAGEEGCDFLRPDPYTAEQVLAEIVDLLTHPDNAHIEHVEVRRIGRVDGASPPTLDTLPSLKVSNVRAGMGWTVEYMKASFYGTEKRNISSGGYALLAKRLVSLLGDRSTDWFTIDW